MFNLVPEYNDARRFGYMTLVPDGELGQSKFFAGLGVEPLGCVFLRAGQANLTSRSIATSVSVTAVTTSTKFALPAAIP